MSATEYVVLVDQNNEATGIAEKLTAHQKNLLHRAFSVFIFRQTTRELELLLQQRAADKYHCPLLWTNTCCSHPRQNEAIEAAGQRRLHEELGIHTTLTDIGWFHYNAHFTNGLSENEIDHVLIGTISPLDSIIANPSEVQAFRWITLAALKNEMQLHPQQFTPWLQPALIQIETYLASVK